MTHVLAKRDLQLGITSCCFLQQGCSHKNMVIGPEYAIKVQAIDPVPEEGTPLNQAILAQKNLAFIENLSQRIPINQPNSRGKAALHLVSKQGNKSLKKTKTPLHLAASNSDVPIIQILLKRRAATQAIDVNGFTPLYLAAENGQIAVIDILLSEKASIEATANNGCAPLHPAAYSSQVETIRALLAANANIEATANSNNSIQALVCKLELWSLSHSASIETRLNLGRLPYEKTVKED